MVLLFAVPVASRLVVGVERAPDRPCQTAGDRVHQILGNPVTEACKADSGSPQNKQLRSVKITSMPGFPIAQDLCP